MRIIEVIALENGAHRNQDEDLQVIPEGWAVIPEDMECENFPFGEVEAEEIEGVMTVTKWTAGELPKDEQEEDDPKPTLGERVTALEESNAEMTEALDMILNGVVE